MASHLEYYQAKHDGVTLHTWTEVDGVKKENYYLTGMPGTPVALWFRAILEKKRLADIADFPHSPTPLHL
ncbi:MAG: hypothetical protein AB7N91_21480 [Candidatus Tectimicrobiota bacterium]